MEQLESGSTKQQHTIVRTIPSALNSRQCVSNTNHGPTLSHVIAIAGVLPICFASFLIFFVFLTILSDLVSPPLFSLTTYLLLRLYCVSVLYHLSPVPVFLRSCSHTHARFGTLVESLRRPPKYRPQPLEYADSRGGRILPGAARFPLLKKCP